MSGRTPLFTPGTLRRSLEERSRAALDSGALQPIETAEEFIEDGGVRFLVRRVPALARKHGASACPRGDPFLPCDPALLVADVSATHVALLNKFSVVPLHLLVVTREFEHQERVLSLADFEALLACMEEFPCLGFYNGGAAAGASQSHKHLQLVPLPLAAGGPAVPVQPLLDAARFEGEFAAMPGFGFAHVLARRQRSAAELRKLYLRMLRHAGIVPLEGEDGPRQSGPYNLLLGPDWMLLVPRGQEFFAGMSVNALAYAGSLFVRDEGQFASIRSAGPLAVLAAVGAPRVTG